MTAAGGSGTAAWQPTGIGYPVEVSSDAAGQLAQLPEAAGPVAGIPRAIRAGATIGRVI